jgi:hypothetical protein
MALEKRGSSAQSEAARQSDTLRQRRFDRFRQLERVEGRRGRPSWAHKRKLNLLTLTICEGARRHVDVT